MEAPTGILGPNFSDSPYICGVCRSHRVGAVADSKAIVSPLDEIQGQYGKTAQTFTLRWHCFSCSSEWFSIIIQHVREMEIDPSGQFYDYVVAHTSEPFSSGETQSQRSHKDPKSSQPQKRPRNSETSNLYVPNFGGDLEGNFLHPNMNMPTGQSIDSQLSSVYSGSSPGLTVSELPLSGRGGGGDGDDFGRALGAGLLGELTGSPTDFRQDRGSNPEWQMPSEETHQPETNRGKNFNVRDYNLCRKYGACEPHRRQKKKCTCYQQHQFEEWRRTEIV